jgi:hypothetical protein
MAGVGLERNKLKIKRQSSDDLEELLGTNPLFTNKPNKPKKHDTSEDFLDKPVLTLHTSTTIKTVKSITTSTKTTTTLRRSASADSDDFLYLDPFKDSEQSPQKRPKLERSVESEVSEEEKRNKLKSKLEKELEHTIPHLAGVCKGMWS